MVTNVATSQNWKKKIIGQITKNWINGKHEKGAMN
jgi:hypothetical protein